MYAPYGARKRGGMAVQIILSACIYNSPPEPGKVESSRFPLCSGCPYPRHGLFCWTDSETCLRTEMTEIEQKNLERRMEAAAY
jgi:hypothetical protein